MEEAKEDALADAEVGVFSAAASAVAICCFTGKSESQRCLAGCRCTLTGAMLRFSFRLSYLGGDWGGSGDGGGTEIFLKLPACRISPRGKVTLSIPFPPPYLCKGGPSLNSSSSMTFMSAGKCLGTMISCMHTRTAPPTHTLRSRGAENQEAEDGSPHCCTPFYIDQG